MNLKDARYALVIITISLYHEAIKSKDVEIINQICPGDFTNNYYTIYSTLPIGRIGSLRERTVADEFGQVWMALSNIERQIFRRGTHNLNLVRVSTDFTL